ncbi:hypothetical protein OF83DRAFT_1070509 [Amylostereum chailletii]|nr:hypothetical protein OF83DRAFT_1070509 [Amylostereum chailletii]
MPGLLSSSDTVTSTLRYFTPPADGSKPYQYINSSPLTKQRERNWQFVEHAVDIENLRGKENEGSLDTTGFQFFKHPAKHTAFDNDEAVEREYYPESIEFIKQATGASRVVLFDHTIRRRRPEVLEDTPDKRQPVSSVHVDQTTQSATARVHRHLPAADVPTLLSKRFQIINLWRPINHAAEEWPLALCDYRSIDVERDLVAMDLKYPDRDGETFGVRFHEGHKWKYVRGLTPEEGVLIKCFDSVQDGSVAIMTPHTAFEDPTSPPDAPKRESIELRALVFYD